jgi:hypothetical protein
MDFDEALKIGKRKAFFLWIERKERLILTLNELTSVVEPESTSSLGIQEIPVKNIVGTEARPNDFAQGFYPIRKDMEQRWTRIRSLMLGPGIPEAITVFEYGNAYFVRDGNHRASVAKTNGIEFISADVTQLKIPITLPPDMTRQQLPLLRAKYAFSQETPVFNYIPEEAFQIACPENWAYLKKEIFEYHKQFYIRNDNRVLDDEELIRNWNFILYSRVMDYIRTNALIHLFPGKLETDIFCDMIRLLNSYPDPDSKWIGEIYEKLVQKAMRRRWLRIIPIYLSKAILNYRMSTNEARDYFLSQSKLLELRPEAVLPPGDKQWYRFLIDHVLKQHVFHMKKRYGRVPFLRALIDDWYDTLFHPAQQFYESNRMSIPFSQFYMEWARAHYRNLFSKNTEVTLESLFKTFKETNPAA